MRRLSTCLLIALVGGLLLAGCGKSSSTSSTQTVTTGGQASGASTSSGATTTTSTGTASPQVLRRQVATCQRGIKTLSQLSASARAKLEANCEKAGASATAQRKVVHEICRELASRLPAGVARERALTVCRAP